MSSNDVSCQLGALRLLLPWLQVGAAVTAPGSPKESAFWPQLRITVCGVAMCSPLSPSSLFLSSPHRLSTFDYDSCPLTVTHPHPNSLTFHVSCSPLTPLPHLL